MLELHGGCVDAERYGTKAANLAAMASLGLPVPPGICMDLAVDLEQADHLESLEIWIRMNSPESLAVRTSSPLEDLHSRSGAGFSQTYLDVQPSARSALEIVRHIQDGGAVGSVVVQSQVRPDFGGVAFYERETQTLQMELSRGSTTAVTSGDPPEFEVERSADWLRWEGNGSLPAEAVINCVHWIAQEASRVFDMDVDLEIAVKQGAVWCLQARAITAALMGGPK